MGKIFRIEYWHRIHLHEALDNETILISSVISGSVNTKSPIYIQLFFYLNSNNKKNVLKMVRTILNKLFYDKRDDDGRIVKLYINTIKTSSTTEDVTIKTKILKKYKPVSESGIQDILIGNYMYPLLPLSIRTVREFDSTVQLHKSEGNSCSYIIECSFKTLDSIVDYKKTQPDCDNLLSQMDKFDIIDIKNMKSVTIQKITSHIDYMHILTYSEKKTNREADS